MKVPRHRCRLSIFADYFQFYLWDSDERSAPETWTEQDVQNRAKATDGVVVISPIRNMSVPVEITIWDSEPHYLLAQWQHLVEVPLLLQKDFLEIHECTGDPMVHFSIPAGDYTVRALFRGLDSISGDGLEGEDFYEVQIWPQRLPALRVLKQWPV
jgi:hypothetical protein